MPMIKPKTGEDEKSYVSRCMSDPNMNSEFPDQSQRSAVCYKNYRTNKAMKNFQSELKKSIIMLREKISQGEMIEKYRSEIDEVMKARIVGGYESPEPGSLPEAGSALLARVYSKCRADGGDKEKCSRIAWSSVRGAGYKSDWKNVLMKAYMDLKNMVDGRIEKALPVGTVHTWNDGSRHRKEQDGTWSEVTEGGKEKGQEEKSKEHSISISPTSAGTFVAYDPIRQERIYVKGKVTQIKHWGTEQKAKEESLKILQEKYPDHKFIFEEDGEEKDIENKHGQGKEQESIEYDDNKVKSNLTKRGISGDRLLDEMDKIEELKDNKAIIDNDGNITVYHRTSKEKADKIKQTGTMFGEEDGLFFSTSQKGQAEGFGDSVIEFKIPVEKIEIDDLFGEEAHVRLPLRRAGINVNIGNYLKKSMKATVEKSSTQPDQSLPEQDDDGLIDVNDVGTSQPDEEDEEDFSILHE